MILLCIRIVDWVQMITQVLLTGTGLVMACLAYRTYLKTPWQESRKEKIASARSFRDELTVFETSKQRTKLVIDSDQTIIECYLLNKKANKEELQWEIRKEEATKIIQSSSIFVNPNYKPNTGAFTIGQRRNWLYSKRLFPDPDYLKGELKSLLEKLIN